MHQTSRFSFFSSLLLLLSVADLYLVGLAVWYRYTESTIPPEAAHAKPRTLDLILVSCSQLLYLLFVLAWLFRWMNFYPGNPIQNGAILCGLSFSVAAACTAPFGPNSYSFITIVVAVVTAGMWLLAAIGSAAV
jgi:hypothetical protein